VLVERSVLIDRPPAEVFAFVADYANDPRWRRAVREMTPTPSGPAAIGTQVHEVLRFGGRTHVTDTTIVDVQPDRSLEYRGDGTGGRVRGSRTVEPAPNGARLTTRVEVETTGVQRWLEPLLAPMFRRATQRDLHRLARLLAADQTATGSSVDSVDLVDTANAAASSRR
jgi:uncharacterized protein YndB with AHSA1/START domain